MKSIPPFYVGQKVVCVETCNNADRKGYKYKKGETYAIQHQQQCDKCGDWVVGCIPHGKPLSEICMIHTCGNRLTKSGYWTAPARCFRATTDGYKEITFREVVKNYSLSEN